MADFGFVGASYEAPSIYQDAQECINFFPEVDPTKQGEAYYAQLGVQQSRGVVALYPTPGLIQQFQLFPGQVRGMRALSKGQYLIIVSAQYVYSIDTSNNVKQIGTLTTTTGQVSITDNQTTNNGLTAYIVDGVNRYTWVASTNTFAQIASTDGPWTGASACDTVDNYIIYNEPNTQNWAATDLGLTTSVNAYYGTKDGSPDNLISLIVNNRNVYLLGEVTSEVWVDVGNQISGVISFPFARIPGSNLQHGCAAPFSIARFADQFMFVSKDTRGQTIIGAMQGYQFVRLSTHAVEQSLLNQVVSDAVAFTYQIEGHEMYVVTFPSANITWVYDLATKMWHKWLYWNQKTGQYERHRANCGAFFNGTYYVGDYSNGMVYSIDNNTYTDNGSIIRRLRRAPHLVSDLQRQYFNEFQIQFQPGVGLITGQGQNPQAMLRWSNDGGSTWSNEHWVSIGAIGKYKNRAIWRRLGWSRDKIFEVVVSDPIKAVIVSANLKAEVGDN